MDDNLKAMIQAVQSQGIVKLLETQVNGILTVVGQACGKKGKTNSWDISNPVNDGIEALINAGGILNRLEGTDVQKLDVNKIVEALGGAASLKKTESNVERKIDILIDLVNKQEVRVKTLESNQPPVV